MAILERCLKGVTLFQRDVRLILVFAVLGTSPASTVLIAGQTKPNVLFIAIDDLNDWVGCLEGHPQARTPNIDLLAKRGTLFTNAHCQGPICGPSRASLLSGLYPHTTGVYQQPRGDAMARDAGHFRGRMLPEYFARHGYKTLAVGKITHGYPVRQAFQEYGGKFAGSGPKPSGGKRFNYHLPDVPWTGTQTDWGAFPESDDQMPDHKAAKWAVDQLTQKHDSPFFLAVGFVRPHVPFYVPQKWFDVFPLEQIKLPRVKNDDLDDVPEISRRLHELPKYPRLAWLQEQNNVQFRKCVQAYLSCTTFVDYQVGRILDALGRSPYADNTIIVLFSDHGYHLGEKDRVSKHSLWEESTRVPLIVVPSKNGSRFKNPVTDRCSRPVGLIDIYPTLVELCGLPARPSNEGRSLTPLMKDADSSWRFSVQTTYAFGNHALRSQRYRYIRYEDGSEELYDHQKDPYEWTNLASHEEHTKLVARFRKSLPAEEAAYHKATRSGSINKWFEKHLREHGVR
ncbi:MAG: sulfatase [Pirellulales bacterium]